MESLLSNYASSDDEEPVEKSTQPSYSKPTGFLSSLPPPKSSRKPNEQEEGVGGKKSARNLESSGLSPSLSLPKPSTSLFSSIPQPKSSTSSSSSLFSSLPQPTKTQTSDAPIPAPAKKVVQFRPPPINPSTNVRNKDEDEDDEDAAEDKRKKQPAVQTASVKSFLSSIPAPRNSGTLGALPSASGTGRRSIIDADLPGLNDSDVVNNGTASEVGVSSNVENYEGQSGNVQTWMTSSSGGVSDSSGYAIAGGDYSSWGYVSENYTNYAGYGGYENSGSSGVVADYQNWGGGSGDSVSYSGDYGNYANYGQHESNWSDGPAETLAPEVSVLPENASRVAGKRGRNGVPQEIIEVKQDELMKNRPREDQVKLTGIAFGPAYQPTSTKGKPTKLHKRKHQIGSLYFDMKQKETELAERRARGFLTKAQTQGKYGW